MTNQPPPHRSTPSSFCMAWYKAPPRMACPLSAYRHLFGRPAEGVHAARLLDVAAADYVGTLLLAYLWSRATGFPLVLSTICCFAIGLLAHALCCVPTGAARYLGLV